MLCNRHYDEGRTFGHLDGDGNIAVVPGWLRSESYQAMPSNGPFPPMPNIVPLPTPATLSGSSVLIPR